jgi:NDP-sugar pyrophosphorylase family protein
MKALILAGGLGTRMKPLTFSIPKPLLPFGDKPILEHAFRNLRSHGVTHVLLALGYMPELIRAYCREGRQWDLNIEYVVEDRPLGTAGPLGLAREKVNPQENIIVMNGDVLTDLNFTELMRFHEEGRFGVTMAYASIVSKSAFGVVEVENGRLVAVREKPETTQLVNAGIYVVSGRCISLVPNNTYFTMPQLMSTIIERGEEVGAFPIRGFWRGLETRTDIDEALAYLNSEDAPQNSL